MWGSQRNKCTGETVVLHSMFGTELFSIASFLEGVGWGSIKIYGVETIKDRILPSKRF